MPSGRHSSWQTLTSLSDRPEMRLLGQWPQRRETQKQCGSGSWNLPLVNMKKYRNEGCESTLTLMPLTAGVCPRQAPTRAPQHYVYGRVMMKGAGQFQNRDAKRIPLRRFSIKYKPSQSYVVGVELDSADSRASS